MSRELFIWGAGGHAKVVLDTALSCGVYDSISFVDDDNERVGTCLGGFPILGKPGILKTNRGGNFLIAIGCNRSRRRCFQQALSYGLIPARLIHPAATVSRSAVIGRGTLVMPAAVINADAVVGDNCILNTGAIIEHDCRIGDDVHISPRAVLGGGATIEGLSHVGIGAVVFPGATVGFEAIVGGGAVVLKGAPAHSTVVGVPAKRLRSLERGCSLAALMGEDA
jgi:sugar O-acyltransferase (sialic acid O-acetyltransferase NeuD family)